MTGVGGKRNDRKVKFKIWITINKKKLQIDQNEVDLGPEDGAGAERGETGRNGTVGRAEVANRDQSTSRLSWNLIINIFRTPVTTKENGGKSTTWKDKGSKDKTVEGTEKGSGGSGERNWDERIAEFLHKIGDTENATKVYCGSTEKGKPPETANYWANLAMAKERSERDLAGKKTGRTTIAEATTTNVRIIFKIMRKRNIMVSWVK